MSRSRSLTPLPLTPNQITAQWLGGAIDGETVVAVDVDEVLAGSTTKVFVRAAFASGARAALCVKGVFDEPRLPVRVLAAQQEAHFFGELAPTLQTPLFRCWFADADPGQGIVVFDDLRGGGTAFTDVAATWPVDRVAAALEVQAAWHAGTWGYPADRHAWLVSGNQVLAAATDALFSEPHWSAHLGDPTTVQVPDAMADQARMERAVRTMFALQARTVHALSHGDAHIGNTYIDEHGRPGFYDWQTFCLAPPLDDATYFIGSALSTADRRAHEQDLLRHYLSALTALGVPAPGWDEAWLTYRRYQIHGFFWAVLPTNWQPVECSVPMAERYIAGIEDHDTLELLDRV